MLRIGRISTALAPVGCLLFEVVLSGCFGDKVSSVNGFGPNLVPNSVQKCLSELGPRVSSASGVNLCLYVKGLPCSLTSPLNGTLVLGMCNGDAIIKGIKSGDVLNAALYVQRDTCGWQPPGSDTVDTVMTPCNASTTIPPSGLTQPPPTSGCMARFAYEVKVDSSGNLQAIDASQTSFSGFLSYELGSNTCSSLLPNVVGPSAKRDPLSIKISGYAPGTITQMFPPGGSGPWSKGSGPEKIITSTVPTGTGALLTYAVDPVTNSWFAGWTKGCISTTDNDCSVAPGNDVEVAFGYKLKVHLAGSGTVTVTKPDGTMTTIHSDFSVAEPYIDGTNGVPLVAQGSLIGWGDSCDTTNGKSCYVKMTRNRTATAAFEYEVTTGVTPTTEAPAGTLMVKGGAPMNCSGTTATQPKCSAYKTQTQVTVTATPAPGAVFKAFDPCPGEATGNICTVTVGPNLPIASVVASFDWVVTVNPTTLGTVTPLPTPDALPSCPSGSSSRSMCCPSGSICYAPGTPLAFSSTPKNHATFTGWTLSGAAAACDTPGQTTCAVSKLNGALTVTAAFQCPSTYGNCSDVCDTDLSTSNNCGSCGHVCTASSPVAGTQCTQNQHSGSYNCVATSCDPGFMLCPGNSVNPDPKCVSQKENLACTPCDQGTFNCNLGLNDACECKPNSHEVSVACASSAPDVSSMCESVMCQPDSQNCNGTTDCSVSILDPSNCGMCGNNCSDPSKAPPNAVPTVPASCANSTMGPACEYLCDLTNNKSCSTKGSGPATHQNCVQCNPGANETLSCSTTATNQPCVYTCADKACTESQIAPSSSQGCTGCAANTTFTGCSDKQGKSTVGGLGYCTYSCSSTPCEDKVDNQTGNVLQHVVGCAVAKCAYEKVDQQVCGNACIACGVTNVDGGVTDSGTRDGGLLVRFYCMQGQTCDTVNMRCIQ